jgi:hypothetical protein
VLFRSAFGESRCLGWSAPVDVGNSRGAASCLMYFPTRRPLNRTERSGPRYLGASVNAVGHHVACTVRPEVSPRRSPKLRGTAELRKTLVWRAGLSSNRVASVQRRAAPGFELTATRRAMWAYHLLAMNQRGGTRANNAIQLSVCVVTPRACARVAPTQPAPDRVRWAERNSAER